MNDVLSLNKQQGTLAMKVKRGRETMGEPLCVCFQGARKSSVHLNHF